MNTMALHNILTVLTPEDQSLPLVFASPHSGRDYLPEFVAASRLRATELRRSEDSFIDELFSCAPSYGAPLIAARFPRAYCDPNREPYELDPSMFCGPLPPQANTQSPRVAAGLGTIARVVGNGAEIYGHKLTVDEAEHRISTYYHPYHTRLRSLVEDTRQRFGWSLLVDCHSMPSTSGGMATTVGVARHSGVPRVDVVLGDNYGSSCARPIMAITEEAFQALGYRAIRNTPYAGGFTTRHYGQPQHNSHALQIELNRGLYMEEALHTKSAGFSRLAQDIEKVIAVLAEFTTGFMPL